MAARHFSFLGLVLAASYVAVACGGSSDDEPGPGGSGGAAGASGQGGGSGTSGRAGSSGQGGSGGASGGGGGGGQAGSGGSALTVKQIEAGDGHTCALADDGSVRCWGQNAFGGLGYGHTDAVGDDESPAAAGPVALGGKALQLAAGTNHTCALLEGGDVRCWGQGDFGRLGYGDKNNVGDDETPASVAPVGLGGKALQISAGGASTCAVLEGGQVRCWGRGSNGQLGYGNTDDVGDDETPADVAPVDLGGEARQVSVGGNHACAVLEGGDVRCWGLGSGGRLGRGNKNSVGDNEPPSQGDPVALGGKALEVFATTGAHTCAVLEGGDMRCWGFGYFGGLGYGDTNDVGDNETPDEAGAVDLGGEALHVTGGFGHSCAVLEGGDVRCWGQNDAGQLGYGDKSNVGDDETPSAVGVVQIGGKATQISAGFSHTCALLEGGQVRCWGLGVGGRLGRGNEDSVGDDETPASVDAVRVF